MVCYVQDECFARLGRIDPYAACLITDQGNTLVCRITTSAEPFCTWANSRAAAGPARKLSNEGRDFLRPVWACIPLVVNCSASEKSPQIFTGPFKFWACMGL